MRVWTVQPAELYEQLKKQGVIHTNIELSEYADWDRFRSAYDWLVVQMIKRIGIPPRGVTYPFWAWHTLDWKHQKPDLRSIEFRGCSVPSVCLELEIPDNQLLLSDEESWHFILHRSYLGDATSDAEYDAEMAWFEALPAEKRKLVRDESWQKVFNVEPLDDGWQSWGQYIQATFWELRLADVRDVRHFCWPELKH